MRHRRSYSVVSLGAQPAPRTAVMKSGIAYDVRGQGPVVVLLTGANLDLRWARKRRQL